MEKEMNDHHLPHSFCMGPINGVQEIGFQPEGREREWCPSGFKTYS